MALISLAGWSLHRRFMRPDADRLLLTQFPRLAKEEFGISAIELNSPFFLSLEDSYVKKLRSIADGEGVKRLNIAIDAQGDLSSASTQERAEAVERHARWFPVAAALGCNAIRANTGGHRQEITDDLIAHCADSFAQLADKGKAYRIAILIENHGGISANPDNVVRIMAIVGENIGTLVDFGNIAPEIRYEGVAKLALFAKAVHAKMHDFDEYGEEKNIDIGRCVRILKDAGYDGYFGIEYEGGGDDHVGVLKAKALLEKYL